MYRKVVWDMKVFMIGGTGLLGSEAAKELIARGHEVSSIALPPLPEGAVLPPEMKIEYGNYLEMTDEELKAKMEGCEGFVFAAGVDERVEGPAPIYDLYKKYNIDPIKRLLKIAKDTGVKHVAICGSYFSYFAKKWPELKLTKYHPYIRSRIDQENAAFAFADDDFAVAVLELPYIFGTQPGRKPVWMFLADMIDGKQPIFYPKGGSTMITIHQVAQSIAGAIEKNKGANAYPIGWYKYTWKQMFTIMEKQLGMRPKPYITIPNWMYTLGSQALIRDYKKRGIQPGLDFNHYAALQCGELYIDKSEGAEPLCVTADDIEKAMGDSIRLAMDIKHGKVNAVSMKGE